jgi:hypothetical protein
MKPFSERLGKFGSGFVGVIELGGGGQSLIFE